MKIEEKALLEAGYTPFVFNGIDYEEGKLLTFGIIPKIDLYYQTDINYCQLVTGGPGRGNRILFDGKIDTMEELRFVINACSYFMLNPIK